MEEKKVLLSVKDLEVKFRVRGRVLTAIRGISLDIYENESIAIVGESGSGKSVFTKTFAGMLDKNGFISNGSIYFDDDELAETIADKNSAGQSFMQSVKAKLDSLSSLEFGADIYKKRIILEDERKEKLALTPEEEAGINGKIDELKFRRTEMFNQKQTFDPSKEKDRIRQAQNDIDRMAAEIKELESRKEELLKKHERELAEDASYNTYYETEHKRLDDEYASLICRPLTDEMKARNEIMAKEFWLSTARHKRKHKNETLKELYAAVEQAFKTGEGLYDPEERGRILGDAALYVKYKGEDEKKIYGRGTLNLARVKADADWEKFRGSRIATVFQDPMTSLNPIITIGRQIMSIILKHQNCSEGEARIRAIELMKKVGIPNAEKRFDDYPFQYSGGMRQRIVIAIALSCQPKILICDEPTTALDVTIQAQILKLLKDLQREYNYTIVFITHDLGVVANVADRVAVLYAGQVIELGTVEEVFYDPRHPYTWALLSSLPQLAERGTKLYSITGTPPSLYNSIVGDAFAPRNPYCMKIDTLAEPPMFKVTETHYARTWLLHEDAPETKKPEIIEDIHGKLMNAYHLTEG